MAKTLTDALEETYGVTDCSNRVHDWIMPSKGKRFFTEAESLGLMRSMVAELCDGDGCIVVPERRGLAYQLTNAGYEALTALNNKWYPADRRRFWIVRSPY